MDSYVCLIAMDRRLLSSTWKISNAVWYSFALFWLTVASWLNFPLATTLFSHRRPVNFFPLRFGLPIIKNQLTFPFDYSWLHCFLVNVLTIWSFVAWFSWNNCWVVHFNHSNNLYYHLHSRYSRVVGSFVHRLCEFANRYLLLLLFTNCYVVTNF